MPTIQHIFAREILDSRGNPTVEVEMTDGEHIVRSAVPSGASTGSHEALELRDGDKNRFGGKGVLKAINNINTIIAPAVKGKNPQDFLAIEQQLLELDGTKNKNHLGANALLGVSMCVVRLGAMQKKVPLFAHIQNLFGAEKIVLPRPMMNILNGGTHSDAGLAVQEFMVFPRFSEFTKNLQTGAEIFHILKKILTEKGYATGVGDEGGFAPHIKTVPEALDTIMTAIEKAGYKPKEEVEIALDAAASEFYRDGMYAIDGKNITSEALVDYYGELLKKYPISSIEDSHSEDDFRGFRLMQERFGSDMQLVGDDLLVTNIERLKTGIEEKLCNSILIKINQIGTISETFSALKMAKEHNFSTVISHRSGETEDTFIADLAVGTNAGQIKTGSLSRSERVCKYNQLLRIGEVIGKN